jgi:hypothetical protein
MKRGISGEIIKIIIIIIVFIFIIYVLFLMLKAASYSGRPQAKFAYALAGSIDFLVNKPAQISQSIGSIGLYISAGIAIAAFVVGGSRSALAAEAKSLAASQSARVIEGEASSAFFNFFNRLGRAIKNNPEAFASGGAKGIGYLLGNPVYQGLLGGSLLLYFGGSITNTIASDIQKPILYYLAPEGVILVNLSSISEQKLQHMYKDLNNTFAQYIQKNYCSNTQSSSCQSIYLTYLIAKYLYNTWGETLGQSVSIAGTHNEYIIFYLSDSKIDDVTQEGVLCMLGMMNYYGRSPLQQMYGIELTDLLKKLRPDGDIVCNIASEVLYGYSWTNQVSGSDANSVGIDKIDDIARKVVFVSYQLSGDNINPLSCTNNPGNCNIIVPKEYNNIVTNSGFVQFTYEGGSHGIIVTSLFGNNQG